MYWHHINCGAMTNLCKTITFIVKINKLLFSDETDCDNTCWLRSNSYCREN